MADIFDIAGRINSTSQEKVVTTADQIKDETQNKKQNVINADVARHENEIHGTGGIDSRLSDVEQMEQIVIDGGDAQIATGADFTNPDATKRAKVPTVGAIVDGLNDDVYGVSCYSLTNGVYGGGITVGTSTMPSMTPTDIYSCVKITGKVGDKINIAGAGGSGNRLWYVYDSSGVLTRVADANADTTSSPVTITFGEGEKYLCVNVLNISSKKVWMLHIPDKIDELDYRVDKVKDGIEELNELLMKVEDVTSDISWTDNRFIRIVDGSVNIVPTSTNNKVGYVDITNSNIVKFKCSVFPGANYSKLAYYFTDGSRILARSITLPAADKYNSGDSEMQVPNGAKYLYISWDNTITSETQYPYVITKTLKDSSNQDSVETINLENTGVQIYEKVKYNNNDYSYTKFGYVITASGYPDYELPNPVVLDTLVDAAASSRMLQIADNATFITPLTITLDLVSDKVTVYNLEPNKIYYYRVYKDGSTSSILNNGRFDTCGCVRFLKIDATEDFSQSWIKNVRDLGGWNAKNNTKTRYGCIIRGYELNHITEGVETVYISNDGKAELIRLGVSAELDLRGETSVYTESVLGGDVAYYNIGLDLWFYRLNIYNTIIEQAVKQATAIRKVLEWLEDGKGIYIHCQGGCDRTGALCAMIEGLCGVSENDINHDYELSDRARSREYYHITGNTNPATNKYDGDFKFAMEYIKGLIEYDNHIYVYYRNNYYDAEAVVTDYTPVPLTDASLISNLAENNYGSLQKRFERLLVGVGGLTMNEVERLRNVLCS